MKKIFAFCLMLTLFGCFEDSPKEVDLEPTKNSSSLIQKKINKGVTWTEEELNKRGLNTEMTASEIRESAKGREDTKVIDWSVD